MSHEIIKSVNGFIGLTGIISNKLNDKQQQNIEKI